VEREQIEIPRIGRVRVVGIFLDGRKSGAVGRTVNVGAILYFHGLLQVGNQTPKLVLHVVFRYWPMTVEYGIERHLVREIGLFEVGGLLLELF
jgi:hypothetical protein